MKEIPLTQNQVALVSDEDYEELSRFKWYATYDPPTRSFYAMRKTRLDGKWRAQPMHRQILGLCRSDKLQADHKNHNTLDNRRENLRPATSKDSSRC